MQTQKHVLMNEYNLSERRALQLSRRINKVLDDQTKDIRRSSYIELMGPYNPLNPDINLHYEFQAEEESL